MSKKKFVKSVVEVLNRQYGKDPDFVRTMMINELLMMHIDKMKGDPTQAVQSLLHEVIGAAEQVGVKLVLYDKPPTLH